jgi:Putative TM nitroreductase
MTAAESSPIIFSRPVADLVRRRFSCRSYSPELIDEGDRKRLEDTMAGIVSGPFGSPLRFRLIAATGEDTKSLRGLGTYGFIRGATGFLIGAVRPSKYNLEDYGYRLEQIILLATDLGLGSCWLGGTFTGSGFARKISRVRGEIIPAVASVGRMADPEQAKRGVMRRLAGSAGRLSWDELFHDNAFGNPLPRETAKLYAEPLEMVRLAPSASNKQPWRILRTGNDWHFYLRRTPGYRKGFFQRILRLADLQRVDMGIAMCHFELAARELGLRGEWIHRAPDVGHVNPLMEYSISWAGVR